MVMAVAVASVFAAETFDTYTSTITLNAEVKPVAPVFEIYASTSSDFAISAKGSETLEVGNPAEEDIKVYFRLGQTNIARYEETFNVTIEAAQFTGTFEESTVTSDVVPDAATGTVLRDDVVSVNTEAVASNKYTSNLVYAKKMAVNPIADILTMSYKWDKDETLPSTTYKSSISIEIKVAE